MPSSYVGARSIEELAAALTKLSYTPRTEQQRREQSENLYRNQLEQALLSAQQQYDTSDLALQNQLSGLETATQRQIEAQRQNTANAISSADRRALGRGMQRSTYNNSVLANLQRKGDEAEAQIQQNRTDKENTVAAQRALLSQQLAQNQTAAQSQYENNVLARMMELEQQDYERGLAADQFNSNTQLQLYSAQQADAQRAQQQAQFEAGQGLQRDQMAQNQNQFDLNLAFQREKLAQDQAQFEANLAFQREKLGGTSGSSSRSSGSPGANNPGTTTPPPGTTGTERDYTQRTTAYQKSQANIGAVAANRAVMATHSNITTPGANPTFTPSAERVEELKAMMANRQKQKASAGVNSTVSKGRTTTKK